MAFLKIEAVGGKNFAGYLQINGGKEITLYDNLVLEIPSGRMSLEYHTKSSVERKAAKTNRIVGVATGSAANYAMGSVTGGDSFSIQIEADDYTVVVLNTYFDGRKSFGTPEYSSYRESEQGVKELRATAAEMQKILNPHEDKKGLAISFALCLFLGWLGVHCFYNKDYGKDILYIFTFGLFGIGWSVDTIKLLIKWVKAPKSE